MLQKQRTKGGREPTERKTGTIADKQPSDLIESSQWTFSYAAYYWAPITCFCWHSGVCERVILEQHKNTCIFLAT